MKPNPNFKNIHVQKAIEDKDSILYYYKRILSLRKEHKDLWVYGDYTNHFEDNTAYYVYTRKLPSSSTYLLVLLNFSEQKQGIDWKDKNQAKLIVGNYKDADTSFELRPWEAKIFEIG